MTRETTSLVEANSAREEWRHFALFLRRPQLPERARKMDWRSVAAVCRLYALDFLLMTGLAAMAGVALLLGVELPDNVLEQIDLTPAWIAVIVIGAPLTEEAIFRGGLSGRPGHVVAAILASIVILALLPIALTIGATGALAGIAVSVMIAVLALWKWRHRAPMGWFSRYFPAIFWLMTLAFGFMHLLNYQAAPIAVLLPLALPQIVAGSLFGYARVKYGLWAAILLHAMHNASAVALALFAENAMRAGG